MCYSTVCRWTFGILVHKSPVERYGATTLAITVTCLCVYCIGFPVFTYQMLRRTPHDKRDSSYLRSFSRYYKRHAHITKHCRLLLIFSISMGADTAFGLVAQLEVQIIVTALSLSLLAAMIIFLCARRPYILQHRWK